METIYLKGHALVRERRVHFVGSGLRGAYFDVEGEHGIHHVLLGRDNRFNCTCPWGSLRGAVSGNLCSHVVASTIAYAEGLDRGDIEPQPRKPGVPRPIEA